MSIPNIKDGDWVEAIVAYPGSLIKGSRYIINVRNSIIALKAGSGVSYDFCYMADFDKYFKRINLTGLDKEIDEIRSLGYPYNKITQ